MARQRPLINGRAYHFVDITLDIPNFAGSIPFISITGISYKKTRAKGHLMANTPDYESRFYGENTYEASISMYKHMADKIREAVSTKSLVDLTRFDIIVQYKADSEAPLTKDVIKDCEFTEEGVESSQGDEGGMPTEYPLIVGSIEYGGQGGQGIAVGFDGNQAFVGI